MNSAAWGYVVPPLSALAGLLAGAWLSSRRESVQRRYAFIERQLRDFYSPLLSLRREISAKSEFGRLLSEEANAQWQALCVQARKTATPEESLKKLEVDRFPEFERMIQFDNQQLEKDLLPAYREMIRVFRANLWLAEPETREYYPTLLNFVSVWDRWLERSLPREVIAGIGHKEQTLHPFYDHLAKTFDHLRHQTQKGKC